jgi:hypothetical protein
LFVDAAEKKVRGIKMTDCGDVFLYFRDREDQLVINIKTITALFIRPFLSTCELIILCGDKEYEVKTGTYEEVKAVHSDIIERLKCNEVRSTLVKT